MNTTLKDHLLQAAFTGNDDMLLAFLRQVHADNCTGLYTGKTPDPEIMSFARYSTKHRNAAIAAIAVQIDSQSNTTSTANHDNKSKESSTTISQSNSNQSTIKKEPVTPLKRRKTPSPPPPAALPVPFGIGETPVPSKLKQRVSPTQKVFAALENQMEHYLKRKQKVDHSLITELTVFLNKNLDSMPSDAILSIFHKLARMMATSLIDANILEHSEGGNVSLHSTLKRVFEGNLATDDKKTDQMFKSYISSIQSEIKRILKKVSDDVTIGIDAIGIGIKTPKKHNKSIKSIKALRSESAPFAALMPRHSGKKRKFCESEKERNVKNPRRNKRDFKRLTHVDTPRPSAQRRKLNNLAIAFETPHAFKTTPLSATITPPDEALERIALEQSSAAAVAPEVPMVIKSRIKDGGTDSESDGNDENESDGDVVSDTPVFQPPPRRSARNANKTEKLKKSLFNSDVFGKESEDESSSEEDEQQKRLQIKKEKEFLENKKRNKERIEQQRMGRNVNGGDRRGDGRPRQRRPSSSSERSGSDSVRRTSPALKPQKAPRLNLPPKRRRDASSSSERGGATAVSGRPVKSNDNTKTRPNTTKYDGYNGFPDTPMFQKKRSRANMSDKKGMRFAFEPKERSKSDLNKKDSAPQVVVPDAKRKKAKRKLNIPKPPDLSLDSEDLSDSPSLSLSDTEFDAVSNNGHQSIANKEESQDTEAGTDKQTRHILEKFVTAYRKKENIRMWLITLKAMSKEQLAIIKDDARFVKYLKRLRENEKYKTFALEIMNKCK